MNAKDLFIASLGCSDADRAELLDAVPAALRDEVRALLEAHTQAQSEGFMDPEEREDGRRSSRDGR